MYYIDRTGPPDYAITAITGFTSLILLIASVFVIYARNYEPVKNKQVHILLPSVYSGVIFILSSLVRSRIYDRVNLIIRKRFFVMNSLFYFNWIFLVLVPYLFSFFIHFRFFSDLIIVIFEGKSYLFGYFVLFERYY